ncbi:hypothetical protein F5B22DRAFT_626764, partial [Xylaria bambusicola]|uniref:uncharacterized protein n=1 Tax=Xylaria bambusicola TaxID=326684 RepID=UPI002007BE3F
MEDPSLNDNGGWDAIHVGAAAVLLHSELVQQLRSPGRLFIPVTEEEGNWFSDIYIWIVDKDEEGHTTKTKLCPAQFVSLMDAPILLHRMIQDDGHDGEVPTAEEPKFRYPPRTNN